MKKMHSYKSAENALAWAHKIGGPATTKAFRGRLKHFHRLGIPSGSRPGKGAKVQYSLDQLYEWAFCLELAECGIHPSQAAQFVLSKEWKKGVLLHWMNGRTRADYDLFFVATPNYVGSVCNKNRMRPLDFRILELCPREADVVEIVGYGRELKQRRTIIINLSQLTRDLV
jgi:hypothetical protein